MVDMNMARCFRQFKHQLHLHYQKFKPEEASQHPPAHVEADIWVPLCEHFQSDQFKKRSEAGKNNRMLLEINHFSGSKSYSQRLYEMNNPKLSEPGENIDEETVAETNDELSQVAREIQLYYDTHTKDDVWIHEKAKENYDMMIALSKQTIEDGDGDGQNVLEQVLGKKSGYSRGRGYGVKPNSSTSAKETIRFQMQRVELAERQTQHFNEEVQNQRLTIAKLEESNAKLEESNAKLQESNVKLQESQLNLQKMFQSLAARFDAINT